MNPVKVLKRLDSKSIWRLMKLCFRYPIFVWPTISATKRCMQISTQQYGKQHYKNGPANAFRHALWNFLIAQRCHNWRKNEQTVLIWTEKITDWHENAFPNTALAKMMDLHNNQVGRSIFQELRPQTESQAVEMLKKMTVISAKIDLISEFESFKNKLVHITEES